MNHLHKGQSTKVRGEDEENLDSLCLDGAVVLKLTLLFYQDGGIDGISIDEAMLQAGGVNTNAFIPSKWKTVMSEEMVACVITMSKWM